MEEIDEESAHHGLREAKEVFIFMHRYFRASRNVRANWIIHHLGKPVKIELDTSDVVDEYKKEMSVVGITPVGGDGTENVENEEFVVTCETKVVYISRFYRHSYVLDMSPSTIVADDEADDCLSIRVLRTFKNALRCSVKEFVLPGTRKTFQPQVHLAVIIFVPFLKFEHDHTLIQNILVTESNVDEVLRIVEGRFYTIFRSLYQYSKKILREWGKLKRRYKNYKFESFCDNASLGDDLPEDVLFARESIPRQFKSRRRQGIRNMFRKPQTSPTHLMEFRKGYWKVSQEPPEDKIPFTGDGGYILPEWAMIFMLRLGLINTHMLPEHTQTSIIIITDTVCGMPNESSLQKVLSQLRSHTISLSLIQLQRRASGAPVFGHIGSYELLNFMAKATFGTYLPKPRGIDSLMDSLIGMEFDEIIEESEENINLFHRALICWSFQNALNEQNLLAEAFSHINSDFVSLQERDVGRHCRFMSVYHATINQLMYVRLREGFTIKSIELPPNDASITITLSLAFRPLVFIDYVMKTKWPSQKNTRQKISVEILIEAPYHELKDLLTEGRYLDPERLNLTKSAVDGIIEADRMLLHIHSFDTRRSYYRIPSGVTIDYAAFHSYEMSARRIPSICIGKRDETSTKTFVGFWRALLDLNDHTWQRWVHTHAERAVLTVPELPFNVFNPISSPELNIEKSLNKLHSLIKADSSFCLVNRQTYVKIVYENDDETQKPKHFYLRKVCLESGNSAVVVVKTAFLGGISSADRRDIVDLQRNRLIQLSFSEKREGKVMNVIRKPIEKLIIRYTDIPSDLRQIVRVKEATSDEEEIKRITLHNTISKCLSCRRSIIFTSPHNREGGAYFMRNLTDYIINVLVQRRVMDEKFEPLWTQNNILAFARQVYHSSGNTLEQFVQFPAATLGGSESQQLMRRIGPTINRMAHQPNLLPSKKSSRALAIVSEFWYEPEAGSELMGNTEKLGNRSAEVRLNDDANLASIIFSIHRILRLSGTCVDPYTSTLSEDMGSSVATGVLEMVLEDDYEQTYGKSDWCRRTSVQELTNLRLSGEKQCKMQCEKISPFVTIYTNLFNFLNVLHHSNRKCVTLRNFVKNSSQVYECNQVMLRCLHTQLAYISDCTWILENAENDGIIEELERLNGSPKSANGLRYRVFSKGITPWMIGMVVVPVLNGAEERIECDEIPIYIVVANEAQQAYCAVRKLYDKNGIVDVSIKDVPEDWFSRVRFGWRPNNHMLLPDHVRDFTSFASFIEEDIIVRTRMAAMFEAAKRGIEVNEEEVCEMAIDVDYVEFEMEQVPQAMRFLCQHLRNENCDMPPPKEKLCSEETNINVMFNHMLSLGFVLVPGTTNMYYMKPKGRKRKRKTESSIDEQIYRIRKESDLVDERVNPAEYGVRDKGIPLFIQFNCSIIFPDGTMDTFPIDFLPSCIYQVLSRCNNFPEEEFDVQQVEIGLELLVMTSNRQKGYETRQRKFEMNKLAYKNPVEFYRHSAASRSMNKLSRQEEGSVVHREWRGFIAYLPKRERQEISLLVHNVKVILAFERILVESRSLEITAEKLKGVVKYIEKSWLDDIQVGYIERREKPLTLVYPSKKSKDRFLKLLDGLEIGYTKLHRLKKTNTFYCRKVENVEVYRKWRNQLGETDDTKKLLGEDEMYDFWIILNADQVITVHFCQRYMKRHSPVLDLLWRTVRQKLRVINQVLLLERMFETRECDEFLISTDNNSIELPGINEPFSIHKLRCDLQPPGCESTPSPIDDTMRFHFAPGHFACSLQRQIWFPVHQRLREISLRQRKPPLAYAFDKLRISLQEYGVRNVPNTYIVKDPKCKKYMYMQLHMNIKSYEQSIRNTKIELKRKHILDVEKRMESEISMTIFSIDEPDAELCAHFQEYLTNKLNNVLFAELQRGYAQNREQALYASEFEWLQSNTPFGHSFFSIPAVFSPFISALLYYVNQHLDAVNDVTRAIVKDWSMGGCGSRNTSFSSSAYLSAAHNQHHNYQSNFEPYQPFAGIVPPQYSKSSFYIYLKLPSAGVTSIGIGVIELRIVTPEGHLIEHLSQPMLNPQSHELLVPNVPGDKSTVYRDIIKVQRMDSPTETDKSVCGFVEVIVWRRGEFDMRNIDEMMNRVIEMSMYDIITEFGYLNTTIVESGMACNGTFSFYRHETSFESHSVASDPQFFGCNNVNQMSCDNQRSEMRRSHHGGSMEMSAGNRSILSRLNSFGKEVDATIREELNIKRPDYINRRMAYDIMKWMDFVASKHGDTNSIVKDTIRFECQHAILTPLFEIRNRIEFELGGSTSGIHENVYLCGLKKTDSDYISTRESSLSIFGGQCSEGRFEVLTTDPFVEMKADIGVDESKGSPNEYLIVSLIRNVFSGFGDDTVRSEDQVNELVKLYRNHLHARYEPMFETQMFSPRQKIMFAMMKGEQMTVYYYNFHPNILNEIRNKIHKIAGWHNAKTRLLREIGLHKMGITHLSPFNGNPQNEFDYERLIWTDPTQLISKEYPPETFNISKLFDLPEYSNIFYRMYRQPDLQMTMGRTSCVFKSDCVPTNHYEQMLRWRDGLKKRLHVQRRTTSVHDDLLKGKREIKEEDLLLFMRPAKVEKSSESTKSENEDDVCSVTERTSKRASIYGEMSVRSCYVAESDIFKDRGTFIKKKIQKRKPVATFFHEIRAPLLVFESWRNELAEKTREIDQNDKEVETLDETAENSGVVGNGRKKSSTKTKSIRFGKLTKQSFHTIDDEPGPSNGYRSDSEMTEKVDDTESLVSKTSVEKKRTLFGSIFEKLKSSPKQPQQQEQQSSDSALSKARRLLTKPFFRKGNKDMGMDEDLERSAVETGEDPLETYPDWVYEEEPEDFDVCAEYQFENEAKLRVLYLMVQDFADYMEKVHYFSHLGITFPSRRSIHLNRYVLTCKAKCDENPYVIFFKAYEGGIIFVELKCDIPEFVVNIYIYERSKHSTVDYYMIDKMGKLYEKENEALRKEAEWLKGKLDVHTFNYDFHLRLIAQHMTNPGIFRKSFNLSEPLNRLCDFYKDKCIRSENVVYRDFYKCSPAINLDIWKSVENQGKDEPAKSMMRMRTIHEDMTCVTCEFMVCEIEETMEDENEVVEIHLTGCLPPKFEHSRMKTPCFTLIVNLKSTGKCFTTDGSLTEESSDARIGEGEDGDDEDEEADEEEKDIANFMNIQPETADRKSKSQRCKAHITWKDRLTRKSKRRKTSPAKSDEDKRPKHPRVRRISESEARHRQKPNSECVEADKIRKVLGSFESPINYSTDSENERDPCTSHKMSPQKNEDM